MMKVDFSSVLDWGSIKATGVNVFICAISGDTLLLWGGIIATVSTVVYNAIRIYKELKK